MDVTEPITRFWERPLATALLLVVLFFAAGSGCSKETKAVGEIRDAFEEGNYEETILLCRHAIRRDVLEAEVYYYYGLALLEQGRDFESFGRFEEAVAADSTMKRDIVARLVTRGEAAIGRGRMKDAAGLLKFASDLDPDLPLGNLKYLVAEAYYKDREFERAAAIYAEAIVERPDTAVAELAYFNLAESYVVLGDSTRAIDALWQLLERFPRGKLARRAQFKLDNLLYEHAQSEFEKGNYETVIEEISKLLEVATNVSLVQRARFMLGEAYEFLEDYDNAYGQYKTIIDQDRGASGRIVERAREKINALRDSGLL